MALGHDGQLTFFKTCKEKLAREFAMRLVQHLHDSTYTSLRQERQLMIYVEQKNKIITDLQSRLEDSEMYVATLITEANKAAAVAATPEPAVATAPKG